MEKVHPLLTKNKINAIVVKDSNWQNEKFDKSLEKVKPITLQFEQSERIAIVGPSGSEKVHF